MPTGLCVLLLFMRLWGDLNSQQMFSACPNTEDIQILSGKSPSPEAVSFLFLKGSLGWEREVWQTLINFLVLTRIPPHFSKSDSFPATDTHLSDQLCLLSEASVVPSSAWGWWKFLQRVSLTPTLPIILQDSQIKRLCLWPWPSPLEASRWSSVLQLWRWKLLIREKNTTPEDRGLNVHRLSDFIRQNRSVSSEPMKLSWTQF